MPGSAGPDRRRRSVLVTGVGGNVGQGVLRILRACGVGGGDGAPYRLVGTNTRRLSPGVHLCDVAEQVPPARDERYADVLRGLCERHDVALVIPCTDDETVFAGRASPGASVAGTDPETAALFLDKLSTFRALEGAGVPFAPTCLPSEWDGRWEFTIVKPRTGRGSRGVVRDAADPGAFDDTNVVQRRVVGTEITSAFYVRRDGALHDVLTMERELDRTGTTVRCHVAHRHDVAVRAVIERLAGAFAIRGCCNVQSIVDDAGRVWPFEVNCRVSGTASVRHALGFRDVEWLVREHLFGEAPPVLEAPVEGTALRLLMDVVYRGTQPGDVRDSSTPHEVF